ncbi:MAG: hypothetical protein HQL82_05795 [Magnetococcales bacterium]|nr:hypothetical protein [Magnetococcales bacterium]
MKGRFRYGWPVGLGLFLVIAGGCSDPENKAQWEFEEVDEGDFDAAYDEPGVPHGLWGKLTHRLQKERDALKAEDNTFTGLVSKEILLGGEADVGSLDAAGRSLMGKNSGEFEDMAGALGLTSGTGLSDGQRALMRAAAQGLGVSRERVEALEGKYDAAREDGTLTSRMDGLAKKYDAARESGALEGLLEKRLANDR